MKRKAYIKWLGDTGIERVRFSLDIDKGIVKNVMVQYESLINDTWTPIVRYDCAHGIFHRDIMYPDGRKEKQAIVIRSLEDAVLYAEQDIIDHWKIYKQHYIRKKK